MTSGIDPDDFYVMVVLNHGQKVVTKGPVNGFGQLKNADKAIVKFAAIVRVPDYELGVNVNRRGLATGQEYRDRGQQKKGKT